MSSLDPIIRPIMKFLPEISPPMMPPSVKDRLIWVGVALLLYFIMYNTIALGVYSPSGSIDFLEVVTASKIGSLMTLGIGPIVLSSIFLQLFNGVGILKFNMRDPEDKKVFAATQKILTVLLALFEASMFVFFGKVLLTEPYIVGDLFLTQVFVIAQLVLGAVIVIFLDEIVSKYGISSGISLFIAAGVSFAVVLGTWDIFFGAGGIISILTGGGSFVLADALIALLPLFFTVVVFAVVAYAEGMKIEIPLAFGMAKGIGARMPIKFLYVSNIPVILTAALLVNMQLFAVMMPAHDPSATPQGFDVLGSIAWVINMPDEYTGGTQPVLADGFFYMLRPIGPPQGQRNIIAYYTTLLQQNSPIFHIPELIHILIYALIYIICCVIFGVFWVETANMGAKDVASQMEDAGLHRPGFRRDPRIIEKILSRYIPVITILGSAFVGLLAVFADFTGALGTGTGILLTVSILHRFYEELRQMNVFDLYPSIGKFF